MTAHNGESVKDYTEQQIIAAIERACREPIPEVLFNASLNVRIAKDEPGLAAGLAIGWLARDKLAKAEAWAATSIRHGGSEDVD